METTKTNSSDNVVEITKTNPNNSEPLMPDEMLSSPSVPFQRATLLTFSERQALRAEMMEANEGLSLTIDFLINLHQRVLFLENAIDIMTNAAGSPPIA